MLISLKGMFISRVTAVMNLACVALSIEHPLINVVAMAYAKAHLITTYGGIAVLIHIGRVLNVSSCVIMESV